MDAILRSTIHRVVETGDILSNCVRHARALGVELTDAEHDALAVFDDLLDCLDRFVVADLSRS